MSSEEYIPAPALSQKPQPPLSVTIPDPLSAEGPYCLRRPRLNEILANTSPSPWTLTAFMAYLSSNHCLETLEFIMDAARYRKHYNKMLSRAAGSDLPPLKDREYVQGLWDRLIEAYIAPNGSRAVNLPYEVRNPVMHLEKDVLPPAPGTLDGAISKTYELMEESVLGPFLNSFCPQSAHPGTVSIQHRATDETLGDDDN
ncbi:uncharacterized protein K489DRAFT_324499, partial [Dissoconium aciculare CBS 342.82]|uniref:RGS domain-containing protein n=1 Tax=Dissoconium aciculare CBS 342.82 TaxID=1314786 RepID=A0A6J3LYJ5_9PEZI